MTRSDWLYLAAAMLSLLLFPLLLPIIGGIYLYNRST